MSDVPLCAGETGTPHQRPASFGEEGEAKRGFCNGFQGGPSPGEAWRLGGLGWLGWAFLCLLAPTAQGLGLV